jgi:hypothetical protein
VANVIGASNDEDGVASAIYEYAFWGTRSSLKNSNKGHMAKDTWCWMQSGHFDSIYFSL